MDGRLLIPSEDNRIPNPKKHFFVCKDCQKKQMFIPATECIDKYRLKKEDIIKLREMYFENKQNNIRLFLESEVDDVIEMVYGSDTKYSREYINISDKNNKREKKKIYMQRRKKLQNALADHKLELKPHGDCYSYIYYGTPSIDEILEKELKKEDRRFERMITLVEALAEYGFAFDEKNSMHMDYINNATSMTTNDIIRLMRRNKKSNIILRFDDT